MPRSPFRSKVLPRTIGAKTSTSWNFFDAILVRGDFPEESMAMSKKNSYNMAFFGGYFFFFSSCDFREGLGCPQLNLKHHYSNRRFTQVHCIIYHHHLKPLKAIMSKLPGGKKQRIGTFLGWVMSFSLSSWLHKLPMKPCRSSAYFKSILTCRNWTRNMVFLPPILKAPTKKALSLAGLSHPTETESST